MRSSKKHEYGRETPASSLNQDLKEVLIRASKFMIRVKDPVLLVKLITRFINYKIKATHTAVLLHENSSYALIDSRGDGHKIPVGYIRLDEDHPLILYFKEHPYLIYTDITDPILKRHMDLLSSKVSIPSFYRKELVAVLLLGERTSGRPYTQDEMGVFITLAGDVAMAISNSRLISDLKDAVKREKRLLVDTSKALASAIDARDRYTKGHSERVSHYSVRIAQELRDGVDIPHREEFLEQVQLAGLLHDVGKIGIKDHILNKPSSLTKEEWTMMKKHVEIGISILKPIEGLKEIAYGAMYHHEYYDGNGYPFGLKGEEIPLIGRIVAIADAYDTMATPRPYKKRMSQEEAIEELIHCSGKQFDPKLVQIFKDLFEEKRLTIRLLPTNRIEHGNKRPKFPFPIILPPKSQPASRRIGFDPKNK